MQQSRVDLALETRGHWPFRLPSDGAHYHHLLTLKFDVTRYANSITGQCDAIFYEKTLLIYCQTHPPSTLRALSRHLRRDILGMHWTGALFAISVIT